MTTRSTAKTPNPSKAHQRCTPTTQTTERVASPRRSPSTGLSTPTDPDRIGASPVLRFTPYAWAKFIWMRDRGDTEIGAFGVSDADDPLLVSDVILIQQQATWASVEFDDEAVADYFDAQVDAGLEPQRFARIWLHTHPGDTALPSGTDEQTFDRVFAPCDWAVMAIVAVGGETYAQLRFNAGPRADVRIGVEGEFGGGFGCSDLETWEHEYATCVHAIDDRALTSADCWWDEEVRWSDRMLDPYLLSCEALEFIGELTPSNLGDVDDDEGWEAWMAAQDEIEVA